MPEPADPDAARQLLYGFAGHAFTGIPVRERAGHVDAAYPEISPAQEAEDRAFTPSWDKPERPQNGVLDTINLRPSGYNGSASRYRHGRAWFETAQALTSTTSH